MKYKRNNYLIVEYLQVIEEKVTQSEFVCVCVGCVDACKCTHVMTSNQINETGN